MTRKKNLFIVFDGIDGSGKSTQARLTYKWLNKKYKIILTHEPTDSKYGKKIKSIIYDKAKKQSIHNLRKILLKLYTKDRIWHIKNVIMPMLKQGFVISDRYYYSTLVYQLSVKEWQAYLKKFQKLKPDITFIVDTPARIALKRITKRKKDKAIFEKLKFLENIREKYLKLRRLDENIIILNGTKSIQSIFKDVKKEINKLLKKQE